MKTVLIYTGDENSNKTDIGSHEETIEQVSEALKSFGHEVKAVNVGGDSFLELKDKLEEPEVVFALSLANDDKNLVPLIGVLELLELPLVGSEITSHVLSQNADLLKIILDAGGIGTSKTQLFLTGYEGISGDLEYPLAVKPEHTILDKDSAQESIVESRNDLRTVILNMVKKYKEPIVVEEFFIGREFVASVWGNKNLEVLPIEEINPQADEEISGELAEAIEDIVSKAYRVLRCSCFATFRIKLDRSEKPNIVEVDTLPNMNKKSYFPRASEKAGYLYGETLDRLLKLAMNYE